MKKIECWKKVLENDLDYVAGEVKNLTAAPAVIILSGPVGAGKTAFSKRFIKSVMGEKISKSKNDSLTKSDQDLGSSPTYSLINDLGVMVHADFYRLSSREELLHLEIPLYIEGKDFFLVEWGRPYLADLQKMIETPFKFYELHIEINEGAKNENGSISSRNISFYLLD